MLPRLRGPPARPTEGFLDPHVVELLVCHADPVHVNEDRCRHILQWPYHGMYVGVDVLQMALMVELDGLQIVSWIHAFSDSGR